MSLSYEPIQTIRVNDPRMNIFNRRMFAAMRGGEFYNYKVFVANATSNTNIQFSCPPPSATVVTDRLCWITLPVRLTFTGPPSNTSPLLVLGQDAPRAYPIASAIETLRVSLNGLAVSIDLSDVIHALTHYNSDAKLKFADYSGTPNMPDQYQQYSNGTGSIRNPLTNYGDGHDEGVQPRGGFPFTIVSNTSTSAVVDMVIREPLWLSPMYFGPFSENTSGFVNLTQMDFSFNFNTNAGNMMWSHGSSSSITNIQAQFKIDSNSFSYNITQPQLEFVYITENQNELYPLNKPATYPYFDVVRYPTEIQTFAYGDKVKQMTSNNIQLNSIPRRMYIYARVQNSVMQSSPNYPNVYLGINNLSIQFANRSGLLSGASQMQLYQISRKNGLQSMSFSQFAGLPVYNKNSDPITTQVGTIGSIVCIDFATDLGLNSYETSGSAGDYQLLVQGGFYQCDPSGSNNNLNYTLYIVVVSEGSFVIPGAGHATSSLSIVTKNDVLQAQVDPFITWDTVMSVNGGNFYNQLKRHGHALKHGMHHSAPMMHHMTKHGGEIVGGKIMHKGDLLSRLRKI